MSDLISRQAVLDAINGTFWSGIEKAIKNIPSAESTGEMDEAIQGYIKDGYMQPIREDLVSRQGVMEALNKWDKYGCMPDGRIAPFRELTEPEQYVPYVKFDDVIAAIKYYPSAETPTVSEKHQLSEETPTNAPTDLISRQYVLYAIDYIEADEGLGMVDLREIVESLPTAERECTKVVRMNEKRRNSKNHI